MCGIAGLIHRDGSGRIGREMSAMLEALKHRGPDSTGYGLYGVPSNGNLVMRLKLAETEEVTGGYAVRGEIERRAETVAERLDELGANVVETESPTEYINRYVFTYDGDIGKLADWVQDENVEILSIGRALELIKDLGTQIRSRTSTTSKVSRNAAPSADTRMATESDVASPRRIPSGPSPTTTCRGRRNGQLTNFSTYRRRLRAQGHRFYPNDRADRRLHLRPDGPGRHAGGGNRALGLRARRGVHLPGDDLRQPGDGQGHDGGRKPMVLYEDDRFVALASRRSRSAASSRTDRHLRSLRRGGPRMAEVREQERRSHEMGMRTEELAGRTQQRFFELEGEEERFATPSRPSRSTSTRRPRSTRPSSAPGR